MGQKQVIQQNNEYICDIDVSVEEWKAILTDETLMFSTYKDALIQFYNEPEHKSTCKALGKKYNKNPQHFNGIITNFAKAVQKKLNRFEVVGTNGKPTYWIIPMQGKYTGDYFEWTLRPELVIAIEELGMTEIENEYQKFKHLLEYFVAHLEWLTNQDASSRGYSTYIESLIKNKEFYKTGKGYNEDNIQKQVKKWDIYENGKICINIQYNPTSGYKAKTNYLNWEGTGLNVIAEWIDDNISSLILVDYQEFSKPSQWKDLGVNNSITELGLFDNNEPNDNLKIFFDEFNSLIVKWNKDKQSKKNMEQMKSYIDLLESCKNLILTGAPGTGKTYLAKQIAKQIIGVTTDEDLEKSGQFAFVQFHPSYDYTDFVEGLRPTKPDGSSNIGFELKDGVFKEFCKKARKNLIDSKKSSEELQNKSNVETILDDFLIDAIENEIEFDYKNHTNKFIIIPHLREDEYFYAKILNNESMERQLVAKEDVIKVLEKANEIHKPTDIQKLFNTRFKYQYTFIFLILERLRDKLKTKTTQSVTKIEKKDFIFIIDEINRGEISKIFGELFFSIDPSYRGEKGAVVTQYSKMHETNEKFYVPENVYIVGTMNDIDRSVESFDFAMRRRFTWKEITAEESQTMFEGEIWKNEAINRMNNLNNAIWNEKEEKEKKGIDGLNSSYHIGAAYFKNNLPKYDDSEKWGKLWEYHLRPLLFEYLRGMSESEADKLDKGLKVAYENDGQ